MFRAILDPNEIFKLAELPTEVITEIFSNIETSCLVVPLWKCGSSILNYKLAAGVQELHLKDTFRFSTSRWPKLLSSLTSLRVLSISRGEAPLMASALDLWLELKRLPPTLEYLAIASFDAMESLYEPSNASTADLGNMSVTHRTMDTPLWDIGLHFPRLTRLEVSDGGVLIPIVDCAMLPDTITHLRIPMCSSSSSKVGVSALPRGLITGDFNIPAVPMFDPASFWANPPPGLESLGRVKVRGREVAFLPRTLKKTTICDSYNQPLFLSPEELFLLPSRMERVLAHASANIGENQPWTASLGGALTTLVVSRLENVAMPFTYAHALCIPRTLTSLSGYVVFDFKSFQDPGANLNQWSVALKQWTNFKPNPWPERLTLLDIPNQGVCSQLLAVLPPPITQLKTFVSESTDLQSPLPIAALPMTLKHLTLYGPGFNTSLRLEEGNAFPSSLTELNLNVQITACSKFDLTALPPGLVRLYLFKAESIVNLEHGLTHLKALTKLKAGRWNWKILDQLPPSITSLEITSLDTTGMIPFSEGTNYLKVPSSLTRLVLSKTEQDRQHQVELDLPPLAVLKCTAFKLHPRILKLLPKTMRKLKVRLTVFDASWSHFLPPRLLMCSLGQRVNFSDQTITRNWPVATALLQVGIYTEKVEERYHEELIRSATYPDPRTITGTNLHQ